MAYIKTNYVDGVYYPSASSFNNTENGIELCTNKEISVDKNIGDLDDLLISYDNIVEAINSKLTAVSLLSISISSPPLKTNYYLNENLELSGLMMSLNWNNGEKELVPFTKMKRRGLTIFPENGTELTEENTPILIRYPKYEMQVEQEIAFSEVALSSISINTPPIKTTYLVGDVLQLDGLIMSMNYNDGTKKLISLIDFAENNISINPINGSVLTKNNVTVIFSCDGKTTSQALKILYITSMTIKTNPTKMSYFVGENLNLAGLIVNLNRNDGSVTEVPYNNFSSNDITTNPLNNSILNSNANIIITLNNGLESVSTNFNVTIVQISLSSIAIKTPPTKTTYYVGDALNLSGLVVTLNYNNSTKKDVGLVDFGANGITTTPVNGTILIKTYTNITVSCSGRSTSQIITINDVLATSITIKTPPTKITYYVGDALNLSGVILTATYNNGTTKDIPFTSFGTNSVTTNPTNGTTLNINHTSIVFSINGKAVSQSISVEVVALNDISIKTQPTKVTYFAGDPLNLSGLAVKLWYNNGTTKDVAYSSFASNGITTNPTNGTVLNTSVDRIRITKDTFTVSSFITVNAIEGTITSIDSNLVNIWQKTGTNMDLTGLKITLSMNNGGSKVVTYDDNFIENMKSYGFNLFISDGASPSSIRSFTLPFKLEKINSHYSLLASKNETIGSVGSYNMCVRIGSYPKENVMKLINSSFPTTSYRGFFGNHLIGDNNKLHYKYNTSNNTFTKLANLPYYGRLAQCCTINNDEMMILGLTNSSSSSGILSYIYKESTNSYTKITYPLTTYTNGTLLSDGNTICFASYDSPSSGYIYNRSADTWSNTKLNGSVSSNRTRLYYACCVGSYIYTVTVENYDNTEKTLVFWRYNINNKTFENRNYFEPSDGISFYLGSPNSDNGFVYKNKIYLIGMDTKEINADVFYGTLQYDISTSYFVRYPDFLIKDVNGEATTAFNISSDAFIVDNNTKKLYSCVPEV